jgi:hypothetical protein
LKVRRGFEQIVVDRRMRRRIDGVFIPLNRHRKQRANFVFGGDGGTLRLEVARATLTVARRTLAGWIFGNIDNYPTLEKFQDKASLNGDV